MPMEKIPSDSEWLIMEVLWESGTPLPSSEIIQRLRGHADMAPRMVRVLLNRLCQKELVSYEVNEKDARVYHYTALRTREECRKEKSQRFVEHYFAGNQAGAVAALLQSAALTDEQIEELEKILEKSRGKGES